MEICFQWNKWLGPNCRKKYLTKQKKTISNSLFLFISQSPSLEINVVKYSAANFCFQIYLLTKKKTFLRFLFWCYKKFFKMFIIYKLCRWANKLSHCYVELIWKNMCKYVMIHLDLFIFGHLKKKVVWSIWVCDMNLDSLCQ